MEHPGFDKVKNRIAEKEGISAEHAAAILASSSRHASEKAKEHNPHVKRVEVHVHHHIHHEG
jgi:hypothetical protein